MKNLAKLLVMALLVGLFGVVAISSLLATPTVQTPLVATTSYNEETGIRWNEGFGVFEVFNASGVSYIASNHYFNAIGEKIDGSESSVGAGYVKADGTKTYNIMQDIAYNDANLEAEFAGGTRHSITTGAVNGRGFILKNFPIIATETAGTALFRSNGGTIQNLILENPTYNTGTANTGILVYQNNSSGVIDNCEVIGEINKSTIVINIAAIAYTGGGTIRNSTNNMDITTAGLYLAGIVAEAGNTIVYGCTNNGNIISTDDENSIAGGIVGYAGNGEILNCVNYGDITANDVGGILGSCVGTVIKSTKNFGAITGIASACGIIGGKDSILTQSGNENFGSIDPDPATNPTISHDVCLGLSVVTQGDYGISYDPAAKAFAIESMIGLSYIGSNVYFNTAGDKVEVPTTGYFLAASTNTKYFLAADINYGENLTEGSATQLNNDLLTLGEGSTLDGQGFELKNFPIRQISDGTTYAAAFASIATGAKLVDVDLSVDTSSVPTTATEIGLLAHTNSGAIEYCEVSGTAINTANAINFASIAYTGAGRISYCTNNLDITSNGLYVAGILAITESANINNCENKAAISSTAIDGFAGGIAGKMTTGKVENSKNIGAISGYDAGGILGTCVTTEVKDNQNTGDVTGKYSAAGIVGSITATPTLLGTNTTPSGTNTAFKTAPIYLGSDVATTPAHGIYYLPEGQTEYPEYKKTDSEDTRGIIVITTKEGLSYLGSDQTVNHYGGLTSVALANTTTATQADRVYIIANDIDYTAQPGITFTPRNVGAGSIVDGWDRKEESNFKLIGFPVQRISSTTDHSALFNTIAVGGEVKNIDLKISTTFTTTATGGNIGIFSCINNGTIRDCTLSGMNLETDNTFSTIVNGAPTQIEFSSVGGFATINSNTHATQYLGCTNKLNIKTPTAYIGGITGYANGVEGSTVIIKECINTGNIEVMTSKDSLQCGGVVGRSVYTMIDNVKNSGNINGYTTPGTSSSGGILVGGVVGGTHSTIVKNTSSKGTVIGGTIGHTAESSTVTTAGIGGIVGYISDSSAVVSCINESTVRTSGSARISWVGVGGIVGLARLRVTTLYSPSDFMYGESEEKIAGSLIALVENKGQVFIASHTVGNYLGYAGIIGMVLSGSDAELGVVKIIESTNNGNFSYEEGVTISTGVAGIVGAVWGYQTTTRTPVNTIRCINNKDILLDQFSGNFFAGGIVGWMRFLGAAPTIASSACENKGAISVTQASCAGTFAGTLTSGGTIVNTGFADSGSSSTGLVVGNDATYGTATLYTPPTPTGGEEA